MKKLLMILLIVISNLIILGQQKASYYSKSFHGRKTASGETYKNDGLTCAHKTFPFGTILKVTNVNNGKSVIVTVNDRGPFVKSRVVDLSLYAFKQISKVEKGVIKVLVALIN